MIPLNPIGWPKVVQVFAHCLVICTQGDNTISPAAGNCVATPPPVRIAVPATAIAYCTVWDEGPLANVSEVPGGQLVVNSKLFATSLGFTRYVSVNPLHRPRLSPGQAIGLFASDSRLLGGASGFNSTNSAKVLSG